MQKGKVYVFLTQCDYDAPEITLFPKERNDECIAVKNQRLRSEKQGVWQLLATALERLGSSIEAIQPYKNESGKWCSDSLYFSLSHSDSLLGVAVSLSPVGIDIENIHSFNVRFADFSRLIGFLNKIRTGNEDNDPTIENLIFLWTAKESVYKMRGAGAFTPSLIDTGCYNIVSKETRYQDCEYHISLCVDAPFDNPSEDVIYEFVPKM